MKRFSMEAGPLIYPVILLGVFIAIIATRNAVAVIGRKGPPANRRSSVDAILFWGAVAALIGFLGQWIGVMRMITAIVERGILSPNHVVLGLSESLLTPVAGMFVFVAASFLWFYLRVGLWKLTRRS